jgi:hypothetical protein
MNQPTNEQLNYIRHSFKEGDKIKLSERTRFSIGTINNALAGRSIERSTRMILKEAKNILKENIKDSERAIKIIEKYV